MRHVKTQLREAVKTKLKSISAFAGVHNFSRITRDLQSSNFPLTMVAVDESIDQDTGYVAGDQPQIRSYSVTIQIGALDNGDDPEAEIEEISIDVEKSLAAGDLGLPTLTGWKFRGSNTASPVEFEFGTMISQVMNYECSLRTLDSAPETTL